MKKLMIGTALCALIATGALAQSPPSSSPSPAATPSPSARAPASPSGKAEFVPSQKPDQFLATKFKGTEVMGSDNQKVGTISDLLFDKDGKIGAYVIAVGGFLGVGSKEVAMAPQAFELMPGENGAAPKLKISMRQDQLKQAQNFARYEPPKPATTGSGGGGLNSLPGSGSKPSSNTGPMSK